MEKYKKLVFKIAGILLIVGMIIFVYDGENIQVDAATKKPTKIDLNYSKMTIAVGGEVQLKVKSVKPAKASKKVKWKSSDNKIATVNFKGMVKGKRTGTVYITATANGKVKARCKVIVKEVKLNKKSISLAVDCKTKLKVQGMTAKGKWYSSDSSVVEVSGNGNVIAVDAGFAFVKVKVGGKILKCRVTVTEPQLSVSSINKIKGRTCQLYVYGTNGIVKWKSENTSIAKVSSKGVVEATGYGTTNIIAIVDGKTLKCKFTGESVPRLESFYYISGIDCYALADTVVHVKKQGECDGIDVGEIEEVGDVAIADYSDKKTYPVYETYWYRDEIYIKEPSQYIDVYLVGTSQTAIVSSKTNCSSKLKTRYIPKDGYGIIRIYSPNGAEGIITIKVDGYTYRIATDTRGRYYRTIDPEVTDYSAKSEDTVDVIRTYSDTFVPSDLGDKFASALEEKIIALIIDCLFMYLFGI